MTDNVAFIRSLYDAYRRGDVNTILDSLDPSVEWVSHGDGALIPWGGRRSGRAGAASFFQALADALDIEAFEPRRFLASGDTAMVTGRTRARAKGRGGEALDLEWAHVFALVGGKVKRFEEFYDSQAAAKAMAA
jgi:ketosteroid isomerase-like protein